MKTESAGSDVPAVKPRSRGRVGLWVVAAVAGSAAVLSLVAVPMVKHRVRREIETRCGRALGGVCALQTLTLRADGAHAGGVQAQTATGAVTAEISSIDVSFRWLPLALNRRQAIVVRVSHPALTDQAPLEHVVNEVLVLHGLHSGDLLPRGAYMQRFEVVEGSLRVPVAPFIGARIEGISLTTERDGALDLRWRDAAIDAGPFAAVSSGACTVIRPANTRVADLACGAVHESLDLDALGGSLGVSSLALRILRSAVGRIPGI